ncbi:MAG: DNA alkylation repair protein [Clostridia bacterium]|nr:DNA alkylation repair protein [Clostridia bacterium]
MTDIQQKLFNIRDEKYKEFHSKLMPGINFDTIIGVRTPVLRALIKKLDKQEKSDFLNSPLPHAFYEENNLHGFLISEIKEYDETIKQLNRFLPFVDNWATCDSIRPICFKNNKSKLTEEIDRWILSESTFTVRFAIEMLMVHFLDQDFDEKYLIKVCKVSNDEYYVRMMIAWYLATALAKQYDSTVKIIESKQLSKWIHNKTIQKAIESFRITKEQKEYLKQLRVF